MKDNCSLLTGSYTRKEGHVPEPRGMGVGCVSLAVGSDSQWKANTENLSSIANPSWLHVDKKRGLLFAASELSGEESGVSVFDLSAEADTAEANPLGFISLADGLCHVAPGGSEEQPLLLVSSYASGTLQVVDVTNPREPRLIQTIAMVFPSPEETPPGRNTSRQEAPHVHFASVHPRDGFAYAADLGSDRIWVIQGYEHPDSTIIRSVELPWGYGPRHLAFDPDGIHVYAVCELMPRLLMFQRFDDGLVPVADIDISADTENQAPSALRIHPSGNSLVVSNRFADEILVFSITRSPDADSRDARVDHTPQLDLKQRFSCEGKTPRDVTFSPRGDYLVSGNQDSHSLSLFGFNRVSGLAITQSDHDAESGGKSGSMSGASSIEAVMHIPLGAPASIVWYGDIPRTQL